MNSKPANDNAIASPMMTLSDCDNAMRVLGALHRYGKRYFRCPNASGNPCANAKMLLRLSVDSFYANNPLKAVILYGQANRELERLFSSFRKYGV